ncbi:hypothetical protein RVR_8359 [Actinacidiphila reveromycinica]|uniref:Uncharacterized protein n=1 Tax=Actinacidiphila reveromycinica TaxID=659352 RepID=A0A7U3UYU5_9ACTN|nr:hypothetical protein RVR_8359 [Streptomyces sp. SN-593]
MTGDGAGVCRGFRRVAAPPPLRSQRAYVYRCDNCQAEADPRADWHDARQDQADHRERAHHGLRPQDDIMQVPGMLAGLAREAAQAISDRRTKRPRPARRPELPQGAVLLLVGGILAAIALRALVLWL